MPYVNRIDGEIVGVAAHHNAVQAEYIDDRPQIKNDDGELVDNPDYDKDRHDELKRFTGELPPTIDKQRERADLDAETLETKLLDMGLLDDVEALAKNNKKWEIRWRRNGRISRTDADLIAGAQQLWPDSWESNLDQLFGITGD